MLSSPPSNPFLKIIENSTERSNLLSMAHITGSSVWGKKKKKNLGGRDICVLIADSHYCMAKTKATL